MSEPVLLLLHMPSCRAQVQLSLYSSCKSTPRSGILHQTSIIVDYVTKTFSIFYGTRQFRRVFRRATPLILNFSTRWAQVVNFELRPTYLWGKVLRHPLNMSRDEPHRRSRRCGKEKKYLAPTGNRTTIPWLSSPLPCKYRTQLYRLPFYYILLL